MVAAKSSRSRFWFVRVDGPEEFLRQKCGDLSRCLDTVAMLAAFHRGDTKENPHAHFVIEVKSETQKQSFAVRVKNLFNIEKKSQYALDVWDGARGAGACSYLFHEEDVKILVNKSFSEQDILAAQQANAAVQKMVVLNKEKASVKLVERALEEFADQKPNRMDILAFMLRKCKDGECYYPGQFRLKQFVEEVEMKLTPDSDFDTYVWSVASQLWRN